MNYTKIHFESEMVPALHFRTGVSLHGHTLHSRETVDFIYRLARSILPIRLALERGEAHYRAVHGSPLEIARAWWTPPLSAHQAWELETHQIEQRLEMKSLVSLSDHDNIDAPIRLQLLARAVPVSVEWTVPYGGTFFHIGVHNIPGDKARETMRSLATYTEGRKGPALRELFEELARNPQILNVFNHANWDEKGIGQDAHKETARRFAREFRQYLHAFELNGLRPWSENRTIFDLARAFSRPLISGGDRHANEANTILNMTNASTFSEFVEEIRNGLSDVLITNQYLEPLAMRILQNLEHILGTREEHVYGWKNWSDRVFYQCDDGVSRSISHLLGEDPLAVRLFTKGVGLLRHPQFKNAFRIAFARREEVVL